jgi:hypothetical protein
MSTGLLPLLAAAAVAVAATGCKSEGSYRISWSFGPAVLEMMASPGDGGQDATAEAGVVDAAAGEAGASEGGVASAPDGGPDASAAGTDAGSVEIGSGCGSHGVFGIRITGANTGSDREDVVALCPPRVLVRTVATGTWILVVHGLNANGDFKVSADSPILNATATDVVIHEGGEPTQVSVVLPTLPACGDGVDNDRDGRIDGDDPDCHGSTSGPSEGVPQPMPFAGP